MSFGGQKNPGTTAKSPYDFQGITVSIEAMCRPSHHQVPTNRLPLEQEEKEPPLEEVQMPGH